MTKNEILAQVKADVDTLNAATGRNFSYPKVKFDLAGSKAGTCSIDYRASFTLLKYKGLPTNYTCGTLNFNLYIAARHPEGVADTVSHEVAHYYAFMLHDFHRQIDQGRFRGGKLRWGHSPEWKAIMRELGRKPERCHNFNTTGLPGTRNTLRHNYQCVGCSKEYKISTQRHNRLQRFDGLGQCPACKGAVRHVFSEPTRTAARKKK